MEEARRWIETDESALEMLGRTLAQRPFLLLPPLHRVPLRVGNVVEIVGPSASAKSGVLLQAAVHCILPKDWNGVHFGGMERLVAYFDLDCRFDVLRLSNALRCRIKDALSEGEIGAGPVNRHQRVGDHYKIEELLLVCMRRFLYIRCYSSSEFLSALKTIQYQMHKETEAQGVRVLFLLIDSISAFYWMDRALQPILMSNDNRRSLSLQHISESIVLEISRLLEMEPMLVLSTKTAILGPDVARDERKRLDRGHKKYREFMPSAWQGFVTHRVLLRLSEDIIGNADGHPPIYTSSWLQPFVNSLDKFFVTDSGISMVEGSGHAWRLGAQSKFVT
ncbi:homolog of X-ray repair cross complementing 2 (XRCC2) [Wolffia australiana]